MVLLSALLRVLQPGAAAAGGQADEPPQASERSGLQTGLAVGAEERSEPLEDLAAGEDAVWALLPDVGEGGVAAQSSEALPLQRSLQCHGAALRAPAARLQPTAAAGSQPGTACSPARRGGAAAGCAAVRQLHSLPGKPRKRAVGSIPPAPASKSTTDNGRLPSPLSQPPSPKWRPRGMPKN